MKYLNRNESILKMATGKYVLHLGAVGFTDLEVNDRVKNFNKTLHYKLSAIADVIGVDYSANVIRELEKVNITNIKYGDVEKLQDLNIEGKFDLIIIGDLIEHLSNPGLMLEGIKRFCDENTIILITTPNAFGLPSFIRYLINRFKEGEEHVIGFNFFNISNLLKRYQLQVQTMATCYQDKATSYGLFFHGGKLFFNCFPKLGGTIFLLVKLGL